MGKEGSPGIRSLAVWDTFCHALPCVLCASLSLSCSSENNNNNNSITVSKLTFIELGHWDLAMMGYIDHLHIGSVIANQFLVFKSYLSLNPNSVIYHLLY